MHSIRRAGLALVVLTSLLAGCSASGAPTPDTTPAAPVSAVPELAPEGWTQSVYQDLRDMIAAEAGSGKVAVFDFDNTTQARDISEAVLAHAEESGAVDADDLPAVLFPTFTAEDGTKITISDGVYAYYDALMASGGTGDPMREYSSLPMPALVFAGQPVLRYVKQTQQTYDQGSAAADMTRERVSMVGPARRPFVYPQMADLYGNLMANGYDVWIVSAGITWGVRWMVKNALNPLISTKYGDAAKLPMDHIIGISPLMLDTTNGELVSDYQLSHGEVDQAYLNLDPKRLAQLEILAIPGGVESWHGGKRAAVADTISFASPYLMAGDSDGDIALLDSAANRLVINRMEKPELAQAFADELAQSSDGNWMLQPTLYTTRPGFLPSRCAMAQRTVDDPELTSLTDESLQILEGTDRLGSFAQC